MTPYPWLMSCALALACEPAAYEPVHTTPMTPASRIGESSAGVQVPVEPAPSGDGAVRIYTVKHPDQSCEIVGVLDMHTAADNQDKGFRELRAKAASLGADAVIGAEFEHGDPGQLSHLSGMAARCGAQPPATTSSSESSWEDAPTSSP